MKDLPDVKSKREGLPEDVIPVEGLYEHYFLDKDGRREIYAIEPLTRRYYLRQTLYNIPEKKEHTLK